MISDLEKTIESINDEIKRITDLDPDTMPVAEMVRELSQQKNRLINKYKINMSAWDRVYLARHSKRPKAIDYINAIFNEVVILHGDRGYADDQSIVGGIAFFKKTPITFIGTSKGKTLEENLACNFGMPNPEGYRKALRLMKQAEKFRRPIITFIDTPGAYPGIGAEERGQGDAIAKNLFEMSRLSVPIIAIFTGEGGSGGALALAVADKIIMLENSIFSILTPEGFASILWKDGSRAQEASELMKLTANDLYDLEIVDNILEEPITFDDASPEIVFKNLEIVIESYLKELVHMQKDVLIEQRYEKFRKIGRQQVTNGY